MFNIQEELKKLPDKPGVYILKDENGEILYIGKAVVLKNRVRQYFQPSLNASPKVLEMVSRVREFEYIVTGSELEALILECNLISKYKPVFNILLKYGKHYPYIKVTLNEEYPRILMTRTVEKDGARYFGPYTNATAVRETIALLKKLFPLKLCKKVLPRDAQKGRPCLNYHIRQCLAPCQGDVNKEGYMSLMKDVCLFLGGKQDEIIKKLEKQMREASDAMDFEKAISLRDKIASIRHIAEKQKVLSNTDIDQDVIALASGRTDSCVQVFFIRGGKLIGREHFIFEGYGEAENMELISSFVKQFYSASSFIPEEVILQRGINDADVVEKWLSEIKGSRVRIKVPRKGEKLELVNMVAQNANIVLAQFEDRLSKDGIVSEEGLKGITALLGLENKPSRIEAYDISNTGASEIVASMVVFVNGLPAGTEYRKFRVKSVDRQNDYASMQEVIYRRFIHAQREKAENPSGGGKFTKMPDLILVDGGLGHVNSVSDVLKNMNIEIPVYGMVKDDRHRTRGLVSKKGEIDLSENLPVLRFVTAIQDEAHRFATKFNRVLRGKRYTRSELDEISGVGKQRKKALIKHFGSIGKIKTASLDDLLAVDGINRPVAENIYNHFRR